MLIDNGADINYNGVGVHDETPLIIAASQGKQNYCPFYDFNITN